MASTASSRVRRIAVDLAVTVVVFSLTIGMLLGERDGQADHGDLDALAVFLASVTSFPLLARRRFPLVVFAVTAVASSGLYLLGNADGPPLGPTVALFFLGLRPAASGTGRQLTAATVAGLFVLHAVSAGIGRDELPVLPVLLGLLLWGGAWVIGDRVRMRRERAAEQAQRTQRELRLAVAEERTRIARDLHDSAGHALNVILVQAGAARLLGQKDPGRARDALMTIEDVARETVGEIDRLVHALREDGRDAAVTPPVGLGALETLVDRHRAAGLQVALTVRGDRRPLTRAVDQAAYRIVQEALTNAGRHGNGGAEVELAYQQDALVVSVTNPVPAGTLPGEPRHGIVGMRERAALLGGRLETGARAGGFRVRAELPYGGGT